MAEAKVTTGSSGDAAEVHGHSDETAEEDGEHDALARSGRQVNSLDRRPYTPSWVDMLTDWVRRLPLPAWLFYLTVGVLSTLLVTSVAWVSGRLPAGTFSLIHLLIATTGLYALALLHYLDDWAADALARFRPVMKVDDAAYGRLYFQFTTLPPRSAWIATGIGLLYWLVVILTFGAEDPDLFQGASPLQVVVISIALIANNTLGVVMIFHTVHQLRLVNQIYVHHTDINLFQPGPLYALSRLAARTAIGLSIPTYLWFQANSASATTESGLDLLDSALFVPLIVLTFIWPLWGAHNLLAKEKERLKSEVSRCMELTSTELHRRVHSGELRDRGELKDTLDGLVAEQAVIDKLRTWPWQTQTISGLGAAFLLPIIIWVVQRILERLGI